MRELPAVIDVSQEKSEWNREQIEYKEGDYGGKFREGDLSPKRKIIPNMMDFLHDDDADHVDSNQIILGLKDGEKTPDIDTPELENLHPFDNLPTEDKPQWVEPIPPTTAKEELEDLKQWRMVMVGGQKYQIDMKVIEPYKKLISHGGYYGNGFSAIITLVGCYLPDKKLPNYDYVMEHLFLYVMSTLDLLVVDDYMIVYFHGSTPSSQVPGLLWVKKCYDLIDRRLKKNLKRLLIVHPTIWLKTMMVLMKPFVSSKFSKKLQYVKSLTELTQLIPTEYIFVPDQVKQVDRKLYPNLPIPRKKFVNQ